MSARNALVQAARQEIEHLYKFNQLDDQEYSFLLNYFDTNHHILVHSLGKKETS
jgi:hypothetical protein